MKKKNILTLDEVKHLAKLSNLTLTDEELSKYIVQLEETIKYVKNLSELDTRNVEPTLQTTKLTDVYYEDGEENLRGLSKKDGYFKVKRIL